VNETPKEKTPPAPSTRSGELAGRVFFLVAGGLLLATLVSCACNPVR